MPNHEDSSTQSKRLCDKLHEALLEKIPDLICKHGANKCSLKGAGIIFAWVNSHSAVTGCLNIWFRGNINEAMGTFYQLQFHPRTTPENAGGWRDYEGSFEIRNDADIAIAAGLLFKISYPLSLR